MAFLSLPNEIIIEIVGHLDSLKQIVSVICVNRRLHNLLRDSPLRYNIRFQRSSALIWAARNGCLETVRNLLRLRADVNTKAGSELDKTALHIAAEKGFLTMAKLLLEAGADPEVIGIQGQRPLFTALELGHEEIAGIIFSKMNSTDTPITDLNFGETPLHVACQYERPKATRYFLEAGADVNAKDSKGSTPLQHVLGSDSIVRSEYVETLLALLEFGANPDPESVQTLRDMFGQPPNRKAFGVQIGRTWMSSNSESYGSTSRSYVDEICLHLNLLERKLRQVEPKLILSND